MKRRANQNASTILIIQKGNPERNSEQEQGDSYKQQQTTTESQGFKYKLNKITRGWG